jgi:hypothetical protein
MNAITANELIQTLKACEEAFIEVTVASQMPRVWGETKCFQAFNELKKRDVLVLSAADSTREREVWVLKA